MSMKITSDLRANVSMSSVEIISLHGGNIVIDQDEFPALIAFLQAVQQSFAADVAKCPPGKHNFENGLLCCFCGESQF